MNGKEAFDKMSKEQTMHLIIWQMFQKKISLEELTKLIKEKEKEICQSVNKHLEKTLNQ